MLNADIRRIIHCASGLNVPATTAARAVRDRMKHCAIEDLAQYRDRLSNRDELSALLELVVVHETWLFRDPDAFAAAAEFAQKRVATLTRPLRILSLPCSSGEEPYSIAIALVDTGIHPAQIVIDGIDISPEILAQARHGLYGSNSFRSSDLAFRDRHFSRTGQLYELSPAIRRMVNFSQGNLFDYEAFAMSGHYDMVFCRNLLIYFDENTQLAAINALHRMLDNDGLLFVGYAEVPIFFKHGFKNAGYKKAFALSKKSDIVATIEARPIPPLSSHPKSNRRLPLAPIRRTPIASITQTPPPIAKSPLAMATLGPPVSTPDGLIAQATSFADQGNFGAAEKVLLRYLKNIPDSAQAYFLLGLTSEQKGDPKAAEAHLRRAIYLDPEHYDALCHLALLAEQMGNNSIAMTMKDRAARVFDRNSTSARKGIR